MSQEGVIRRTTFLFALACFVGALVATPIAAYANHQFTDVLDGHVFHDAIDWLADNGITKGCNPPVNNQFCPDDFVTRGEMAVFLVRAMGYTDNGGGNVFVDDDGLFYENAADRLGTAKVTLGCNPPVNDRFCGGAGVTRGQMAAFLVRAMGYSDNGGGNLFTDDDGHIFENAIDKLGAAKVTLGCNPPDNDKYCPNDFVTRGQMAAFLKRALGPATLCDQASVPEHECVALTALYWATGGGNWVNDSWLSSPDVCGWYGVTCGPVGVIELGLSSNQLTGMIPTEIGDLTNLQLLSLYDNELTGTIPSEIGNLTNLAHLDLRRNQLTGSIPTEIGNLTNLEQVLDLGANQLTGPIPPEIGNLTNLRSLSLDTNQLTGSIPPEIDNLTNLRSLELRNNQLTGTIPAEIGNLTNLRALILTSNQLTGSIPPEIGNLIFLGWLYLHDNQLSGLVPTELQTGTNIVSLLLRNQTGCLHTNDVGFEGWLDNLDPLWDNGCSPP